MDETMLDPTMDDPILRRRLEAYAEARLSPDLATSSRLRARVLAVAHRQAALTRADGALAIVPRSRDGAPLTASTRGRAPRRTARRRGLAALALASALGLGLIATAVGATPGGSLYPARLWVESLVLPTDASARAVAELERMHQRLREAAAAGQAGDGRAAAAALGAYATILDEASANALLTGDPVATAALEAGVRRDIAVLEALEGVLPSTAADGPIAAALDRAIARGDELARIVRGASGGDDGAGSPGGGSSRGGGGAGPGGGGGGGTPPDPRPVAPNPSKSPAPTERPTDGPTHPTAEPAAAPTRTPKPDRTPATDGRSQPPGGGDQGDDQGG